MKKRKAKIIKDNKRRGEWAESVFAVRAAENGLPVSKPSGDSSSFDCVVGRPGKFVGVQVKCTMAEMQNGKGYVCSVKKNNQTYCAGSFDFLAAYVIPEDAWYIVPAKLIRGQQSVCLCTTDSEGKYEEYREAWHLLRAASGSEESHFSQNQPPVSKPEETAVSPGLARMHTAMNSFRNHMEKSGRSRR
jgi:PD-(D/E)XK endonuclease